jgi:hypothetical protein
MDPNSHDHRSSYSPSVLNLDVVGSPADWSVAWTTISGLAARCRSSPQHVPRRLARDVDSLKPIANARAKDHGHAGIVYADVKGGVDSTRGDEDRVPWTEYTPLVIDPLLDLTFDDAKDLLLTGVLVKTVPLARCDIGVQRGKLLGSG